MAKLTIAIINTLNVGEEGIDCVGIVGYVGKPKHLVGTSASGREYDFWTQFITLKQGDDEMGVSLSLDQNAAGVTKGQSIGVMGGKIIGYTNDKGQAKRKLQCKLVYTDQPAPSHSHPQAAQGPIAPQPAPQGMSTDEQIRRLSAARGACQLVGEVMQGGGDPNAAAGYIRAVANVLIEWIEKKPPIVLTAAKTERTLSAPEQTTPELQTGEDDIPF